MSVKNKDRKFGEASEYIVAIIDGRPALRRRWQDNDAWFCSELVAWAFEAGGRSLFREHAWRITPRDLYLPRIS